MIDTFSILGAFISIVFVLGFTGFILALFEHGFGFGGSAIETQLTRVLATPIPIPVDPWNCKNCGGPNLDTKEMCEWCGKAFE